MTHYNDTLALLSQAYSLLMMSRWVEFPFPCYMLFWKVDISYIYPTEKYRVFEVSAKNKGM